jgi:hypothetical protein
MEFFRINSLSIVFASVCASVLALTYPLDAVAEQSKRAGAYNVHYVAFASTFLSPSMAKKYNVVRGRNRALINISVLNKDNVPVRAKLKGTVKNLPGQILTLNFEEVIEGDAIYYLAQTRFSDQELMRFNINFVGPDGLSNELKFDQKLYWED